MIKKIKCIRRVCQGNSPGMEASEFIYYKYQKKKRLGHSNVYRYQNKWQITSLGKVMEYIIKCFVFTQKNTVNIFLEFYHSNPEQFIQQEGFCIHFINSMLSSEKKQN